MNKTVVITGANRGIGLALCQAFVEKIIKFMLYVVKLQPNLLA